MSLMIQIPIADMREEPSRASKVVSQALFGEEIQINKQSGDWISIVTQDGYDGWVKVGCIVAWEKPYPKDLEITRISAHIYSVKDTEYGPLITLPHGAKLQVIDSTDARWHKIQLPDGREAFVQKGDVAHELFDLISFSKKFLGLPYTWGGRSSFGFDCSGFVQMIYGRLGIQLTRDARQQILDPRGKCVALDALKLGDLIFWGKSEKEIKHVGMSLGGDEFIHTSARENKPYLRVSKLVDFEWSGHKDAFYSFRAARSF